MDRQRRLPRCRKRCGQSGSAEAKVLCLLDVAVSLRQAAHGPRAQLHDQRHDGASVAHEGLQRLAADGLGCVWFAGGKRGDEEQGRTCQMDLREHRLHEETMPGDGLGHRLVTRVCDLRSRVLQMEPVVFLEASRKGNRLQKDPTCELGPGRSDRARQ